MNGCPFNGVCKKTGCELWDQSEGCCSIRAVPLVLHRIECVLKQQMFYMRCKTVGELKADEGY